MINSKRLAALCGVFFLTSVVTAVAVSPYTDISDKTDKAAVDYVYDIQGLTFAQGTEFHPLQPVSRQEFADMLYRLTPSLHPTEMKTEEDALAVLAQNKIMQKGSAEAALTRAEYEAVIKAYITYMRQDTLQQAVPEQTAGSDTVSRLEAVRSVYALIGPGGMYTDYVAAQQKVMKTLNDEYGSMLTFYEDGVLYRQGDTFVVGLTGRPSMSLERRLKHDLADGPKVEIKKVSMSRSDYAYLMRKAAALIVATVGTDEFSGVLPDYENEQIIVMTKHPLSQELLNLLEKEIGTGIIRNEDAVTAGTSKKPVAETSTERRPVTAANRKHRPKVDFYSPLLDRSVSEAITKYQNDLYR